LNFLWLLSFFQEKESNNAADKTGLFDEIGERNGKSSYSSSVEEWKK